MSDILASTQEQNYEDSPSGWHSRLAMELEAAKKEHADWQAKGQAIVDRYLDKRTGKSSMPNGVDTRLNFYAANVQTVEAMLYGRSPTVDVRPRFADAPDSVARLAGELAERVLNSDIEEEDDGFAVVLGLALKDRLNPGAGFMRFRYCCEWESTEAKESMLDAYGNELAPAVEPQEYKSHEDVETDYVHWRDVLWSPCRTFHEMRWCAFKSSLTKEDLKKRFGEEVAAKIALNTAKDSSGSDSKKQDPWSRADVWEIWDKEHECVWFWVDGHPKVLKPIDLDDAQFNVNGSLKDPLELKGFWPFPEPMLANLTTSAFLPRADFTLCEDLYNEIDRVSTRITELQRAIGAKGVYDKTSPQLARLLTEETNNKLLPSDNWQAFSEKGGFKGTFELMPLDGLVGALDKLRDFRNELIQLSYQLTGMSDIMRGQASDIGATATEQSIKARFASVRLQALQDRLAKFASDGQKIRLEIIAKHFDAETILARSNIEHSFDADQRGLILQAVQLLKSDSGCYRIEVKPDSISLADFAAIKQERTEVIGAVAQFIQTASPMAQMLPGSMPYLLKMLQWMVSGLRGSTTIEGVLEQAIQHAQEAASQPPQGGPPPGPDPKMLAAQAKQQADLQKIQAQTQSELVRMNAETQALQQRKLTESAIDVKEAIAKKAIANGGLPAMAPPMPVPGGLPGGMP